MPPFKGIDNSIEKIWNFPTQKSKRPIYRLLTRILNCYYSIYTKRLLTTIVVVGVSFPPINICDLRTYVLGCPIYDKYVYKFLRMYPVLRTVRTYVPYMVVLAQKTSLVLSGWKKKTANVNR